MRNVLLLLSLALLLGAATQEYTFTGIVLDEQGAPLIGANVLIKGTTVGTVTDIDGRYELKYHLPQVELVVSYVGFTTEEVKAKAGKEASIKLGAAEVLEEVVITGYGRERLRAKAQRQQSLPDAGRMFDMGGVRIATYAAAAPEPYDQHNTEDYALINENRFFEVTRQPLSTFSIDVDAASYSNVRRFIKNGQIPPKDAVRVEELVNYFDYDYAEPTGEHPFTLSAEVGECPWQPNHRLLHVGLQGRHIPTDNLPPSNLVFLVDVSGSMNAPNKLPLVQGALKLLTDQLREQDRVALVVYAGAAGVVLEPTGGADRQKIKDAIGNLQAGGSTAGAAGIQLAYKLAKEHFVKGGNNRVILATDGDFNVGTSSDAELVRLIEKERESGVFLTVLGFGMGNYKDNKMQQLADRGNGNHAYIDDISEARKVLVSEFGGTMYAIAKDVKIQIEFNPAQVRGYRLIGYENRLLNDEDFHDDKKDAGELGAGHTVTALYEIIPAGVESEFLAKVDELKYQDTRVDRRAAKSDDLLTLKLRYKQPDGAQSRLLEHVVTHGGKRLDETSDNFRWAAAVAEFGMLLRESEFRGQATYLHCKRLAEGARGRDDQGYRREFIELIDVMKSLADPEVAGKE